MTAVAWALAAAVIVITLLAIRELYRDRYRDGEGDQ